jgi:putative hydrolase of the HAD superfamily
MIDDVLAGVEAVFLDAGGVLVTPDPSVVRALLDGCGVDAAELDDDRLVAAHYRAMDAAARADSAPEDFGAYLPAYLASLGVAADRRDVLEAAAACWAEPYRLWTWALPGAPDALATLAASGRPVVIVSNADGRVADALAGLLQVGPGPAVDVAGIVDSGVVGVAKPDPAIFRIALDLVDVAPDRVVHVGDAVVYDVGGATAAGITPVLVDPLGLRADAACRRARSLTAWVHDA